jgi:divalent metal cation (Fe/Co/Zn/Cd) transporter
MKYYIGYSGLGATIFYVIVFLSLFFTSVLIFFDKEEVKNIWIMFGLGYLASYWNIFG